MNPRNLSTQKCGLVLAAVVLLSVLGSCSLLETQPRVDYDALIAATDRTDADRNTDKRRKPAQILAFTGIRPGMRVLDLAAGGGYSTELVARAVAPGGTVYGQNSKELGEKALAAFGQRMSRAAMKNVVPVIRNFEDPIPPEARDLDVVTFFFEYHEMPNLKVDRLRMNRRVFEALKPGGYYIVADHSARAGDGETVGRTFHRIEESVVRRDLEQAGFRLVEEGNFLRNPEDRRDVTVFKSPVPVDEFFLKYQKPR
jgi:predicted methyltransferase